MTDEVVQALDGLRVLDAATVVAGPAAARYLADFGADVVKVESPAADPTRRMGWLPEGGGDSYFWKLLGRNKRCVTLDFKTEDGLRIMKGLIDDADVLIENFRPGTLERLGLDPEELLERNPRLVVLRITGFGQTGPYASKPGFATLAEALSGYAAISGEPDGPPLLPPIAITDEIAGIVGAFSVMVALRHAERTGRGQIIDVSLIESLLHLMGPLPAAYAGLSYLQPRMGSALPWSVPRGTYRCSDGVWVALSASADSVAKRLMRLLRLESDARFLTFQDRTENGKQLDELVRTWIGARSSEAVFAAFNEVDAAIAPVYTMEQVVGDPHYIARQSLIEVEGILMQNVVARLSLTPGHVRHAGRAENADAADIVQGGWRSRWNH